MKANVSPCLVLLFTIAFTSEAVAQRAIRNGMAKPLRLYSAVDSKGIRFATLYIMPEKTMVLNAQGDPIKGAGYWQAEKDNYYFIFFSKGGFVGLRVDRVEWDDEGKTVAVQGVRPVLDDASDKDIKITSDLKKPKLKDGILYLKVEGKGDKEFKFKMLFGRGHSIEPPLADK